MRKKSVKPGLLLAMGLSVATFVSCTHGENVYDNEAYFQNQAQQYAKKWQEKFGAIDPEQNWNMATQAKANIAVPSGSTVNVYTGNPYLNQGILLASFTNSGEYTFDAPKGRNLYFQAVDANGKTDVRTMAYNESNTYNVDFTGNAMAKTKSMGVRSDRVAVKFTNVDKGSNVASGLWSSDRNNEWGGDGRNPEMQDGWKRPTTMYNRWHDDYYDASNGAQGNSVSIDASLIEAIQSIIPENKKSDYYSTIIKDVDLVVSEDGPVTLTLAYGATSNQAAIGYYIYNDKSVNNNMPEEEELTRKWLEENGYTSQGNTHTIEWNSTTDPQKTADKYILIQNLQNIVYSGQHMEMKLLYPMGNGNYSETFPKGTKISFFVVPNAWCGNGYINAKYTAFSFAAMNYDVHRSYNNGYYSNFTSDTYATSHAATFKVKDKIVIGFEDAPTYNSNDFDYNDCVFILDGNFKEEVIPDPIPDPEPTPQWIIACEDLGDTEDYDFNDIVFGVTHKAGETTATITPLAAGGVYEAKIFYNNQLIGEIHDLLGHSANEDGKYPMINTGSGPTDNGKKVQTITVPADFTISEGMGGFSIEVTIPQTEGEKVTGLGGQAVRIWGTEEGKAPQMFMLEGTWKWPKETQSIEKAYPNFKNWSKDNKSYDWVNSPVNGLVWETK